MHDFLPCELLVHSICLSGEFYGDALCHGNWPPPHIPLAGTCLGAGTWLVRFSGGTFALCLVPSRCFMKGVCENWISDMMDHAMFKVFLWMWKERDHLIRCVGPPGPWFQKSPRLWISHLCWCSPGGSVSPCHRGWWGWYRTSCMPPPHHQFTLCGCIRVLWWPCAFSAGSAQLFIIYITWPRLDWSSKASLFPVGSARFRSRLERSLEPIPVGLVKLPSSTVVAFKGFVIQDHLFQPFPPSVWLRRSPCWWSGIRVHPMRMEWCVDFASRSLISSGGKEDSSISMYYRNTTYRFWFDSVLIIHVVTSRPEKGGQNHRSVFFDIIAVLAFTPALKKAWGPGASSILPLYAIQYERNLLGGVWNSIFLLLDDMSWHDLCHKKAWSSGCHNMSSVWSFSSLFTFLIFSKIEKKSTLC